jgi:hypothetical protein
MVVTSACNRNFGPTQIVKSSVYWNSLCGGKCEDRWLIWKCRRLRVVVPAVFAPATIAVIATRGAIVVRGVPLRRTSSARREAARASMCGGGGSEKY